LTDIMGLGIQNPASMHMDNYRMSNSPVFGSSSANFADALKKAQARNEASESVPVKKNGIDKDDKLYQACLDLETFLVKNLLTGMRNTVQKSGLIDEGFAGKMYEDMLYDEYAKDFTKNAGFGLAEQAYRQLKGL